MKRKKIREPRLINYLIPALLPALILGVIVCCLSYLSVSDYIHEGIEATYQYPGTEEKIFADKVYDESDLDERSQDYLDKAVRLQFELGMNLHEYRDYKKDGKELLSGRVNGIFVYKNQPYCVTQDPDYVRRFEEAMGTNRVGTEEFWKITMLESLGYLPGDQTADILMSIMALTIDEGKAMIPNTIHDVYFDPQTRTFQPGRVTFIDAGSGKDVDVDLSPFDKSGWEHTDRDAAFGDDFSFCILFTPFDEGLYTEAFEYEVTGDDPSHVLTAFRYYYEIPSVYEVFAPYVITGYTIIILIFCIIAFFIGKYRYRGARALWDVAEYRRKTADAMAHDLKTPLSVITAYAENIREETDPDKISEYSERLVENVGTANRLLEDILNFSRSESTELDLKSGEVSVKDLLQKAADKYSESFRPNDVTVKISGDDIKLNTDRTHLSQAIDNLILNCAQHAVRGSTAEAKMQGKTLTISNPSDLRIADVKELKRPFVKGDPSRKDKGTGLGLSIAENDLNMLGYKLDLALADGKFTAKISFR